MTSYHLVSPHSKPSTAQIPSFYEIPTVAMYGVNLSVLFYKVRLKSLSNLPRLIELVMGEARMLLKLPPVPMSLLSVLHPASMESQILPCTLPHLNVCRIEVFVQ